MLNSSMMPDFEPVDQGVWIHSGKLAVDNIEHVVQITRMEIRLWGIVLSQQKRIKCRFAALRKLCDCIPSLTGIASVFIDRANQFGVRNHRLLESTLISESSFLSGFVLSTNRQFILSKQAIDGKVWPVRLTNSVPMRDLC